MKARNTKTVAFRVSIPFYELMQAYLKRSAHINESNLMRVALDSYLKKEVPVLYQETMGVR